MALHGEAKRRFDTEICLSDLQRAVELLHEARWLVSLYRPELEPEGSLVVKAVEAWALDVQDTLKLH